MHYHPVVEEYVIYPALDPGALLLFTALFAGVALATMRRAALGVAALGFITPFAFYHTLGTTTVTFPKIVVLAVVVGLLPSWRTALHSLRDARAMLWAFAAILVAIALSAIGAQQRGSVVSEFLKWVEYGVFFCAAYAGFSIERDDPLIRRAFEVSIAIVCVSALVQEFTGAPWDIVFGAGVAPRISGVLEGPNQLACYLEVALAIVLAWRTRVASRASAILCVLIGLTLLLSFSRGGVVGCVIVAGVVILSAQRHALRATGPFLGAALAGAILDAGWAHAARTLPILRNPSSTFAGAGGVGQRAELWRAALFFFRRHPVFGIGAGNYENRLPQAGIYGVRTHANNWYLQALAEGGIVLFAATRVLRRRGARPTLARGPPVGVGTCRICRDACTCDSSTRGLPRVLSEDR